MSGRCSLTPSLRLLGRGFLAQTRFSTLTADDATTAARGDAAKHALENAQKLEPDSPETLLALGYYQYMVLRDSGAAKTTFERVSKMLPNSSEVRSLSARLLDARDTGTKALPTSSKPSPWTHAMCRHSCKQH